MYLHNGHILLGPGGHIAGSIDCCCEEGCTPCCEGFANATLFITINNLVLDGGETCDDACIPDIDTEASSDTGGGETACGATSATFFIAPVGAGTAENSTLSCSMTGEWEYDSEGIIINDAFGRICTLNLNPNPQTLTGATCDPFFWEGDLTVNVTDSVGAPCGTGTVHIIITE